MTNTSNETTTIGFNDRGIISMINVPSEFKNVEFRRCRMCKTIKPIFEFQQSKINPDTYTSLCKTCYPIFYANVPAKRIGKKSTEIRSNKKGEFRTTYGIKRKAKFEEKLLTFEPSLESPIPVLKQYLNYLKSLTV